MYALPHDSVLSVSGSVQEGDRNLTRMRTDSYEKILPSKSEIRRVDLFQVLSYVYHITLQRQASARHTSLQIFQMLGTVLRCRKFVREQSRHSSCLHRGPSAEDVPHIIQGSIEKHQLRQFK